MTVPPHLYGMHRKLTYQTAEELQKAVDEYFNHCDKTPISRRYDKEGNVLQEVMTPYTISGLAEALSIGRDTLLRYEKNDLFYDILDKARMKVQRQMEEKATANVSNPHFSIFALKNHYGWVDKTEVDQNIRQEPLTVVLQSGVQNRSEPLLECPPECSSIEGGVGSPPSLPSPPPDKDT